MLSRQRGSGFDWQLTTGHWPLTTSFMDLLYSSLIDLSQFFFLSWIVLIVVACVVTFRQDSF